MGDGDVCRRRSDGRRHAAGAGDRRGNLLHRQRSRRDEERVDRVDEPGRVHGEFHHRERQRGAGLSLVLRDINVKAGSFLKTTAAAPASQSVIGTGFAPSAVFFHSFHDVTQASPVAHSRMSYGASDGVTEGSSAFSDLNAADPTNFQAIDKTNKAFMKVNNSTPVIDAEADLTSLDPDGFTVNWTTNDAVATEILYMGLANLLVTEVRLDLVRRGEIRQRRAATVADRLRDRQPRVQPLSRDQRRPYQGEHDAHRRLGTPGRTGCRSRRRTDLRALGYATRPPATPTVTYWLEDVEFNGKSTLHGPITPVVSALRRADDRTTRSSWMRSARRTAGGSSSTTTRIRCTPVPRAVPAQVAPEVDHAVGARGAGDGEDSASASRAGIASRSRSSSPPGWTLGRSADAAAVRRRHRAGDPRERRDRRQLRAGDAIEFYGSGIETPYTDTRIYWLQAGGQAGRRIAVDAAGPFRAVGGDQLLVDAAPQGSQRLLRGA